MKDIFFYLTLFVIVVFLGFAVKKLQKYFEQPDEYHYIRNYLLNDSPLYNYNKPKIWIHSKFEVNARDWKQDNFRNSTDLNQPYLNVCLKTIINHCSRDFHICLIDDHSFANLIPSWDIQMEHIKEPEKEQYRNLGLTQLLYHYGGILLPNSFVCLSSLQPLYEQYENRIFFAEEVNRGVMNGNGKRDDFVAGLKIAHSPKQHPKLLEFIDLQRNRLKTNFNSASFKLNNSNTQWIEEQWKGGEVDVLCGKLFGIKSKINKPIEIDEYLRSDFLPFDEQTTPLGLYIDGDELLLREKYSWFAVLPEDELFDKDCIIVEYMKKSLVETSNIYYKDTKLPAKVSQL